MVLSKFSILLSNVFFFVCNPYTISLKIVAAFRGMHVSPAKHSFGKCDRRTDRQTDRQTDDRQSDPYVSLCFAGDTKMEVL